MAPCLVRTIASTWPKKSAIWKKPPLKVMSYLITGSPAGPTAAPIGSAAADASVAPAWSPSESSSRVGRLEVVEVV